MEPRLCPLRPNHATVLRHAMAKYLAVLSLILAACAGGPGGGVVAGAGTSLPGAAATQAPPSTTNTTVAPPTTTTSMNTPTTLPPPVAMISPTGVPVRVVETNGLLHRVLTPCGNEIYLADGTPLYGVQVVLDPGHGGSADPGARAPTGLSEDDLNLKVVQATADVLGERGVSVVLTRTGDYTSPLSVRAALADALGADLMLSIHHNAPTQGSASQPGIEVFYQSGSPESKRLGGLAWEYAMEALAAFDINWVAAADAGVMTVLNTRGIDAYGIIRHPDTVTALIELGYISNRAEAELFATPEYVTAASTALADAITAYLETDQGGGGYVTGRVFDPLPGVSRSVCVDPPLRGQPSPSLSRAWVE